MVFLKPLDLKFHDYNLLELALTHRSSSAEHPGHSNNEKLEFLGDAILGMVVAAYLYKLLGDKLEGDLARIKSFVVSEETLSVISARIGIDKYLRMGRGEELSGGRSKKAILADAMEAVIGACYLDSGFKKTEDFVLSLIVPEIENVIANKHKKDYKTLIQEFTQKYHKTYPVYTVTKKSGPDHEKTFWISCEIGGRVYGPAQGKSKKEAEQLAASFAYDQIIASGGAEADRLRQF